MNSENQLAWVKAARQFKASAIIMSNLWPDLDDEAQAKELCTDYPFLAAALKKQGESFDEGPLIGILEWLTSEKLAKIEQRASLVVCDGFPTCASCECSAGAFPWDCPRCHRSFDADRHPLCVACNEPLFISEFEAPGECRTPDCFAGISGIGEKNIVGHDTHEEGRPRMNTFRLTMKIETEIKDEAELERVLRAVLNNMTSTPFVGYFDLTLEETEEGGQE